MIATVEDVDVVPRGQQQVERSVWDTGCSGCSQVGRVFVCGRASFNRHLGPARVSFRMEFARPFCLTQHGQGDLKQKGVLSDFEAAMAA